MERKFYPENFERFLKGHADQFKLTPSKKVWHGIYNDLHPGRRWPSIAMSMVFIFTLVVIGHLNTNNGKDPSVTHLTSFQKTPSAPIKDNKAPVKHTSRSGVKDIETGNNVNESISIDVPAVDPLLAAAKNTETSLTTQAVITTTTETKSQTNVDAVNKNNVALVNKNEVPSSDKEVPSSGKIENPALITNDRAVQAIVKEKLIETKGDKQEENKQDVTNNSTPANTETTSADKDQEINSSEITNKPLEASAANIFKPRKNSDVSWTFYVAPSLGYRAFSDQQVNNAVIHKTMMGYEGGIVMSTKLYKKLQFTTGLQVNLSGYNIRANNTHPILASLLLNGQAPGQFEEYATISHYGNRTGNEYTKLKNYSIQASLPVGLQYAFAGNEKIKFNVATTFQPTYIILGKAYLLSGDKKNYITNPDLLRKWNMNTSLGTFISFSSNSFNWQIGPQVRYQLLSTYTNRYPLKEHLINYGIRIGISNISK